MKPAPLLLAVAAFLFFLPSRSVIAKNASAGIYAIIDQVTFEPASGSPDFVRISGIFVVPVPMSSGTYKSPQRGYLYFRTTPGMEQATRRDWSELKTFAGSGRVVVFGQYWVPNPDDPQGNPHHSLEVTVHEEGASATPDVYPVPQLSGVAKADDMVHDAGHDPEAGKIIAQLREVAHH